MKPTKTYKREIALALLVWLAYIVETKDVQIIEILAWPIMVYVGAAFGIDQYGKLHQRGAKPADGWRPERGSEYPDR